MGAPQGSRGWRVAEREAVTSGAAHEDHRQRQRVARRRSQGRDHAGLQGAHRRLDVLDLRVRGAAQGAGAGRRVGVHLHLALVRDDQGHGQAPQGTPRVLHPLGRQRRVEPVRLRVRDPAAEQAHSARDREGVRRLGAPQGDIPVELHRQPDAAVRGRGRQGRVHAAARLHHRGPGLRARQRGLEHGPPHRRCPDDGAVHPALRPDLEQPRPARRRHRGGLRAHRQRVRRELAGPDLLPDPLQPVLRVPRRHQRGRAAERPHGLPGHPGLAEPLQLPARCGDRHHQQAGDLQRLHPRRQRRPR